MMGQKRSHSPVPSTSGKRSIKTSINPAINNKTSEDLIGIFSLESVKNSACIMNIQDFSDEVILTIFNFLDGNSLVLCGRVSKTFRRISKENSLWLNFKICPVITSVYHCALPTKLIPFLVTHGCTYLDVTLCKHFINKKRIILPKNNNLRSLKLSYCEAENYNNPTRFSSENWKALFKAFTTLIANSHSLSKLAIEGLSFTLIV
jgi:hypothetical protein